MNAMANKCPMNGEKKDMEERQDKKVDGVAKAKVAKEKKNWKG